MPKLIDEFVSKKDTKLSDAYIRQSKDELFNFMKDVLLVTPCRGPVHCKENKYCYVCNVKNSIKKFNKLVRNNK